MVAAYCFKREFRRGPTAPPRVAPLAGRFEMLSYGTMTETFQEQFARGYQARREGRLADSRAIFLKAVRSAAEGADRPDLAEALCGLGQAERGIGNLEAARHHYAGRLVLYRQIGPPERLAYALRHEADILREASLPAEAEPLSTWKLQGSTSSTGKTLSLTWQILCAD